MVGLWIITQLHTDVIVPYVMMMMTDTLRFARSFLPESIPTVRLFTKARSRSIVLRTLQQELGFNQKILPARHFTGSSMPCGACGCACSEALREEVEAPLLTDVETGPGHITATAPDAEADDPTDAEMDKSDMIFCCIVRVRIYVMR
jgi:hypothetical protein